jgi:hypothetical protein
MYYIAWKNMVVTSEFSLNKNKDFALQFLNVSEAAKTMLEIIDFVIQNNEFLFEDFAVKKFR